MGDGQGWAHECLSVGTMKERIRSKLTHRIPHADFDDLEWLWNALYPREPIVRRSRCGVCADDGVVDGTECLACGFGSCFGGVE